MAAGLHPVPSRATVGSPVSSIQTQHGSHGMKTPLGCPHTADAQPLTDPLIGDCWASHPSSPFEMGTRRAPGAARAVIHLVSASSLRQSPDRDSGQLPPSRVGKARRKKASAQLPNKTRAAPVWKKHPHLEGICISDAQSACPREYPCRRGCKQKDV